MKIDFNSGEINKHSVVEGGYEEMMKQRKKNMPSFEKNINDILKGYEGEMLVAVRVREDENAKPIGHTVFVGGVAGIESQMRLCRVLVETANELRDQLIERASGNPKMLKAMMMAMMEEFIEDTKEIN